MNSTYVASVKTFKTKITEKRNVESIKAYKSGYVSKNASFESDDEDEIICITEIPFTNKYFAQMENLKGLE
jgi:hypothetical protein